MPNHPAARPDRPAYRGRFAPSPTGPLHAGSLVAALASRLDALAHDGTWLVRIEDTDTARSLPAAAADILTTLTRFGFHWDEPVTWQSERSAGYAQALARLQELGLVFPCACSRKEIADSNTRATGPQDLSDPTGATLVYPGTCRAGMPPGRTVRAWRLRVGTTRINFTDRWFGPRHDDLARAVGDFVLKRADGDWAYQLAVVVDDALQGITDVVRGGDLLESSARQIYLQQCLGLPTPRYLHIPVVSTAAGEKLSKQTGAAPLDPARALEQLRAAAAHLGLTGLDAAHIEGFWMQARAAWRARCL